MSVDLLKKSAATNQLVVILGAGTSIALMSKNKKVLSWSNLVWSGLEYATQRGLITPAQKQRNSEALQSPDIDDLLGAAEFVGRKLGSPNGADYIRWMRTTFEDLKPDSGAMQNAIRAIAGSQIPISTLNYDNLTEQCTRLPPIEFIDSAEILSWIRRERKGILHLHGIWTNPSKCVFGIRDYRSAMSDETRQVFQRALGFMNRILFVGCGDTFSDPNFITLISWLRTNAGAGTPQHFALVRESEVSHKMADPNWRGFVEPISYGNDYADLSGFLLNLFPNRKNTEIKFKKLNEAEDQSSSILDAYKSFLLRDCGEMTIEGMRADMDVGQRKFDLEKLFVPLELSPFPPDLDANSPDREAKLQQWRLEQSKPLAFSAAFSKSKKLALLALPGGGKTLLLKRLAIAYAFPERRSASPDNLPAISLIPVLIRCREWKEHIRKPIPVILKNFGVITGDSKLDGLHNTLEKRLKAGSVLLLVDGLDEIHNDGDRSVFVENLEKFLENYPKIRFLVTSREAGFDLVAPCLSRFCEKYRIAPLSEQAIKDLCKHWHNLMGGGTPEARSEAEAISTSLLRNASLMRLAENPLLLTMLLVVKHGAGRLPPDLFSLYNRAAEVLLDTWNIKGHEPLHPREAVPQLACLAFELLDQGKQTATERQIISILEEARTKLPMIGRYAKDSPYQFLKRVELRSSLLLEGGHTIEDGSAVPFYQFRHLTFQEYLAAVAATEGYVLSNDRRSSPIAALQNNLVSDEWKEVIPMAAVLARTQARPIIECLLEIAEIEWKEFLSNIDKGRTTRMQTSTCDQPSRSGNGGRSCISTELCK